MLKYNNFSLTGFKDPDIQLKLKQQLLKLGCKHIEKLSQNTNILIVGATWTQKFKIGQLHKNPIPCVTKKWVEESYKKKTLQAPDKFLITEKQLFLGTHIALCGFPREKQQKLQKIIKERQGVVFTNYKAAQIIRNHQEIPDLIDVILASKDEVQRAKHAKLPDFDKDEILLPLVRIQWLQDSLKSKRCKFPQDYAVNLIKRKPIQCYKTRLQTKLRNFFQIDIMQKSGDFLENTLIYIDKDLSLDMVILFKNLIAVCGGYWTDVFSSVVTHVLVLQIDEAKDQYYKKYGSRIYILRPQWLVDSIFLYNRLPQEDYFIRIFRPKGQLLKNLIQQEQMRNNQNSQNFNSLQEDFGPRLLLSTNTLPNLEMQRKKSRTQVKSSIFQGRDFYIPPQVINDPEYEQLRKSIISAGGITYSKINSKMSVFVILKDSPKNREILLNLRKTNFKYKILSQRWLKDCVKQNEFIRPDRNFIHYEAFPFTTPMADFHRLNFQIIGFEELSKKARIRELIQTLGSKKAKPNKSELTHVICGPQWNSNDCMKIINRISKQNNKYKLVRVEWLFACIRQCKIADQSGYLLKLEEIENESGCKIQESIESISDKKTNQSGVKNIDKLIS